MANKKKAKPVKGKGYVVKCPECKEYFHETTEEFDSEKTPHGGMFVLMKKFGPQGFNWSSFPNNDGMGIGDLECPNCGAPYCGPAGERVTVERKMGQSPNVAWVCPDCGKVLKSENGYHLHKKWCPGLNKEGADE